MSASISLPRLCRSTLRGPALALALLLPLGAPALAQTANLPAAQTPPRAPGPTPAPDRQQVEVRLTAVGTLIERSTAAKQIEASKDARAADQRNRAREIYKQAQKAFADNDLTLTSKLLSDASNLMFEAVRQAAPEQVTASKARSDFNARMESVQALLSAQKRIAAEKPEARSAREAIATVERLATQAKDLAAGDKISEARTVLDQAYLAAKASISSMRSGDTLVRSLNFANKEEEYRYEVDRNDTHRMLIGLLLDGKRGAGAGDPMVRKFVDSAAKLRESADAQAGKGDYPGAIKALEDSTAELVRAIRGAGVFIPG